MGTVNYRQIFARQKHSEQILKIACPEISTKSGIYILSRIEDDDKYVYVGKGVNVLRRMCSHLMGYQQRIDISLRKRGFYSEQNSLGWKLYVHYYPEDQLDEKERQFISWYKDHGWTLYNIESGGTIGKEIVGERKAPKTYTDGLRFGEEKARRKVSEYFCKYLDYSIKGTPNKIKERKLQEFEDWLKNEKL